MPSAHPSLKDNFPHITAVEVDLTDYACFCEVTGFSMTTTITTHRGIAG